MGRVFGVGVEAPVLSVSASGAGWSSCDDVDKADPPAPPDPSASDDDGEVQAIGTVVLIAGGGISHAAGCLCCAGRNSGAAWEGTGVPVFVSKTAIPPGDSGQSWTPARRGVSGLSTGEPLTSRKGP